MPRWQMGCSRCPCCSPNCQRRLITQIPNCFHTHTPYRYDQHRHPIATHELLRTIVNMPSQASVTTSLPAGVKREAVIAAMHDHDRYIRTTCPQLIDYKKISGSPGVGFSCVCMCKAFLRTQCPHIRCQFRTRLLVRLCTCVAPNTGNTRQTWSSNSPPPPLTARDNTDFLRRR